MTLTETHQAELWRDGFTLVPDVADTKAVELLLHAVAERQDHDGRSVRRRGDVYGIRNLLDIASPIREWATSEAVQSLITPVIGTAAFPVRGTLFDKTPEANWNVVWHQDLSIAVQERQETPGFGPWSEKAGVPHVQPPAEVLARMLTLRLHLDECGIENGPLRVFPGSHRQGRLNAAAIQRWRQQHEEVICAVPVGGALLMRPLLLHASSDARSPRHRRVIHLDFAAEPLPGGLRWHTQRQRITA